MEESLTAVDLRILEQFQRDSTLSTNDLAEKVGISQSPCWRRLQKLKEAGYIKEQVAIIDRSKFGHSFFVFAFLTMKMMSEEERISFLRKVETIPHIVEGYSLFGDRDVLLKVLTPSMEWYQSFVFKTLMQLPGVTNVSSTATLKEIKYSTFIPLRNGMA